MPDFMAKMHQIRFRLGLQTPEPAGGAYSAPPGRLAGFNGGLLLKGGEKSLERVEEGREGGEWTLDLSASSFWQSWLRACICKLYRLYAHC